MGMKNIINEALEMCLVELKKNDTRNKLIEPIVECVLDQIKPYIFVTCTFFITMIILIISILYLIIIKTQ